MEIIEYPVEIEKLNISILLFWIIYFDLKAE